MHCLQETSIHTSCYAATNLLAQVWLRMLRGLAVAVVLCVAMLGQSATLPQVHRFELADCDDVAFGANGDLYFACHSPQDRLPVEVRGAKSTPDEMDAYVLRLSPRTGKLVFATRIGGRSYDGAWRVSVDRRGHAYATGSTKSADFPTTADALQRDLRGKSDAFLVEVGPVGEVLYSTLIGGTGDELGNGLDIDNAGAVYLGGVTSSSDFKGRQHAKASADDDVFLCRMRPAERSASCLVFGGGKAEKLLESHWIAGGSTRGCHQLSRLPCDPSVAEIAPWNFGPVSDKASVTGDEHDILYYVSAVTCFNTATLSSGKPNTMAWLTIQAANLLTSPIL